MSNNRRPRILDVGQCDLDHGHLTQMLTDAFDARVDRASTIDEAMASVKSCVYDLVLVNRILDADGTQGVDLVRRLCGEENTQAYEEQDAQYCEEQDTQASRGARSPAVMLVSNFEDAQLRAQASGAAAGFGKADLHEPGTIETLRAALGQPSAKENQP